MAAVELEGNNLAEKHWNYNKLANEIIKSGRLSGDLKIKGEDVGNLIKIDFACRKRDLDYILEVLKCDDMLYVSRAIKLSPWLVTDRQYSHIINPEYLHTELFPSMTSKASAKLMLHIRLNLKDEDRVDSFYTHLKEKDLNTAIKWLPNCSLALIEKEVESLGDKINSGILKRLCERSISVLEKYVKRTRSYYIEHVLNTAKFLIKTDTEKYMDLVERQESYNIPRFGPKDVEIIMKKCPQRIKNNFEKFTNKIDLDTFAKYLDQNEIKDFLTKQFKNKNLRHWFKFDNLKHFVKYLPKEGRFEFLKKFFIEKNVEEDKEAVQQSGGGDVFLCAMKCRASDSPSSLANIYCWYRFAPFQTAYPDLTKLIRAESNPTERIAMFGILLNCAGRNLEHVRTVLQYYHDKHINEPFKFKIQFVNMVISLTPTHKYDTITWNLLNNLFHSLEVHVESENKAPSCIEAIVIYKILHDEPIPAIIQKKLKSTLKSHQKKLSRNEQDKVFTYLYYSLKSKIEDIYIKDEKDFTEVIQLVEETLNLLLDWKEDLMLYPFVLEKIGNLNRIKNKNNWKADLSSLYNKNKSWRRIMFEHSLSMWPSRETCYNALKHDPSLLSRNEAVVEELRRNDNVSLRRLLTKMRIYWPNTLSAQWAEFYLARLNQPGGHKALVDGICTLLPQKQFNEIIKKYAPTESKINWSEDDELVLSLRKHLAKNMHLSRPQPLIDLVLLYCQGDYLQFALPSLNATLYNMSSDQLRVHISKVLNAPVSLQKHGIRFAFSKLQSSELKTLFYETWQKAKNPSIRAVLFQQTFYLLCRQKNPLVMEDIWQLLSLFIDNLTTEENKVIYDTLGKVDKVPSLIRGKFIMKSYTFLKTLPAKANCEGLITRLKCFMVDSMEQLDSEFVEGVILDNLDKNITTDRYEPVDLIATYLLCVKDEKSQSDRYQKIMLPILERGFALWHVNTKESIAGYNVERILQSIPPYLKKFVLQRKMVCPTKLFKDIEDQLSKRLPVEKNYYLITYWKLITAFVTLLEEYKESVATVEIETPAQEEEQSTSDDEQSDDKDSTAQFKAIYIKMLPKYSDVCLQLLKHDTDKYFPSIYWLFSDSLNEVLQHIQPSIFYECLESLLKNEDFFPSYLLVLKLVPDHFYDGSESKKLYKAIINKIRSHPAAEVKMHFFQKFNSRSLNESDD